ncbi:hypothetical protein [Roseibium album]|uniref:Uncharacterized protein n=1 Tax=Roseibium album TaxID=311410 RepID=A0A0M6Z6S2_9HYPH|nr:hypothetical protein [Roseibium album]CTQ58468.1 hypothetical protein LA5094_01229 [Roseibium album]CTQ66549.1 hypothetical protein LA5096_01140 [Roseibium album]CTQ71650.1 hypothetical protein LA5095_02284 [Roseibium album]
MEDDLETVLEQIEGYLQDAQGLVNAAENAVCTLEEVVTNQLQQSAGTLSAVLAAVATIQLVTNEEALEHEFGQIAEALFLPVEEHIDKAIEVLETSFDPLEPIDTPESEVEEKFDALAELVNDATDDILEANDLFNGAITASSDTFTAELEQWREQIATAQEGLEETVDAFLIERGDELSRLDQELSDQLTGKLGADMSNATQTIDAWFTKAEKAMDTAESVLNKGVGKVNDVLEPVADLQEKIKALRPIMELMA